MTQRHTFRLDDVEQGRFDVLPPGSAPIGGAVAGGFDADNIWDRGIRAMELFNEIIGKFGDMQTMKNNASPVGGNSNLNAGDIFGDLMKLLATAPQDMPVGRLVEQFTTMKGSILPLIQARLDQMGQGDTAQ